MIADALLNWPPSPFALSLLLLTCGLFFLWRAETRESAYWKQQAERYQSMWDRATWRHGWRRSR